MRREVELQLDLVIGSEMELSGSPGLSSADSTGSRAIDRASRGIERPSRGAGREGKCRMSLFLSFREMLDVPFSHDVPFSQSFSQ